MLLLLGEEGEYSKRDTQIEDSPVVLLLYERRGVVKARGRKTDGDLTNMHTRIGSIRSTRGRSSRRRLRHTHIQVRTTYQSHVIVSTQPVAEGNTTSEQKSSHELFRKHVGRYDPRCHFFLFFIIRTNFWSELKIWLQLSK